MNRYNVAVLLLSVAVLIGCDHDKITSWNPLVPMEKDLPEKTDDIRYVLERMEYARFAIDLGCYTQAEAKLKEAFDQLNAEKSSAAAALSSEKFKYYKGETYERAALNWYLGYINYRKGDFNTARIYFSRSLMEDRRAIIKEGTSPVIGDDFGVAYYWLGKTYQKLGETDNAAIAFKKAAVVTPREEKKLAKEKKEYDRIVEEYAKQRLEGEKWTAREFLDPKKKNKFVEGAVSLAEVKGSAEDAPQPLPYAPKDDPVLVRAKTQEEFFTSDFQKKANVVLTVELGDPPAKKLGGLQNERTDFVPSPIMPATIRVFVDGTPAGQPFQVLEMWDQAATQDRVDAKEAAQATKALTKTVLSLVVNTSDWDVSGDIRRWKTLPGRVYLFAAKLKPGIHTVRLEMFDSKGRPLPRWTNTFHGIMAPISGENTALVRARFDGDNAIAPEKAEMAAKAGAEVTGRKIEEEEEDE